MRKVLEIKNLTVHFATSDGTVQAVNDLTLSMEKGRTLGVVGETGAGKTTLAKAVMGLLKERDRAVQGGEIWYNGQDLRTLSDAELREVRGKKISMIFQDPMTSLNPVIPVEKQIAEAIEAHQKVSGEEALRQALEMLDMVGIPKNRGGEYPHQFSGGMKQRVVIAIAMACNPDLLLADEPTTALDVTIQAQILDMIKELRDKNGTSVMLITHDLGVVAQNCEFVAIVYAGEVVEYGDVHQIFKETAHPYTMGLLGSVPKLNEQTERLQPIEGLMPDPTALPKGCFFAPRCQYATERCREEHPPEREAAPNHLVRCFRTGEFKEGGGHAVAEYSAGSEQLVVKNLKKYFNTPGGKLHAVDNVSFSIRKGETLGVVGESGCGKSTMGRAILRLHEPTSGQVLFDGVDVTALKAAQMKAMRTQMQIIFQDPYSSLNPRMTVREAISEPLLIHKLYRRGQKEEMNRRVREIMDLVGLAERLINTYPHELDGGRRQRIGIARALAVNPKFIVCDEPVSALDVSIQAQVLNLMQDLQAQFGVTYLFITHDLSVVKHLSNEIVVMYLGEMVEKCRAEQLFTNPVHPYTQALLSAIPVPDPDYRSQRIPLNGELTSPIEPGVGCRFAKRCPYACEECASVPYRFVEIEPDHFVSCAKFAPADQAVQR